MSAGNAGAAIGLANTNKILNIGSYVQDIGNVLYPGPSAEVGYAGCNGNTSYRTNVLGEAVDPPFLVLSNSGAAAGKNARWVTNTAPLAASTTRVDVALGVATANNAAGAYDIWFSIPAAGLPANSFFWAFER